jgi:hypothetical protein
VTHYFILVVLDQDRFIVNDLFSSIVRYFDLLIMTHLFCSVIANFHPFVVFDLLLLIELCVDIDQLSTLGVV